MRARIFNILLLTIIAQSAWSQFPEYAISDTTVTDCDGFLGDSGGPDESYAINENYVFTVLTGGTINITFLSEVCIEDGFDFLNIYDGPSTASPIITTITGAGFVPPGFTSSGGALTFEFISDGSASYCGFYLFWDTTVGPPEVPSIAVNQLPTCGANELIVDFSFPIGCDWIELDSILLVGSEPFIVEAADVICSNGYGSSAILTTTSSFNYNCNYELTVGLSIPDECDSIWNFSVTTNFLFDGCPIDVNLIASETETCSGQCIELEAITEGCFTYTYDWSPILPNNQGPHIVCPTETTTYTVVVTEVETGQTGTAEVTIDVVDSGIITEDQTICQSLPAFFIEATTLGGEWFGNGILDIESGLFEPDSSQSGQNIIYYVTSETCYDSVLIDITPIDAGLEYAACPGSSPFLLQGTPLGGTWTGDFTLPDGTFDPSTAGSYQVNYMVNGCIDSSYVNVDVIISSLPQYIFCQSEWADTLEFSPLGGTWGGPGIIDTYYGIFDPGSVLEGNYNLTYNINGCGQIFPITIKEIYTGQRTRTSCPSQEPFIPQPNFSPIGGYWEGNGIIDSQTGEYDPGIVGNDTWTGLVYYAPNGCTDTIFYYNRQTEIQFDGDGHICLGDDPVPLEGDVVGNTPWGGTWSGSGVIFYGDDYYEFSPSAAGVGNHMLEYEVNGCSDSLLVHVYPASLNAESYSICSNELPFILDPDIPEGGTWEGPGMIGSDNGLFDPAIANEGDNWVYWNTPAGCSDSIYIFVETFYQALISNLDSVYCFQNQEFELDLFPDGGTLTGATSESSFNPAESGSGTFTIEYNWAGTICSSSFSQEITVYPSIQAELIASDEIICPESSSVLTVTPIGGQPDVLYSYQWSDDLFPVSSNTVAPINSQYFYVTISDGCSDPLLDSVYIEVLPLLSPEIYSSELVCFGNPGYVTTNLSQDEFLILFDGVPADTLFGTAGEAVEIQVEELLNGCLFDSLVVIPSYTPVTALFSPNPNIDCIPWTSQPVTFIDLSQYGQSGTWDFGNGESTAYGGSNPSIEYEVAGGYTVSLTIENEGNCTDTFAVDICILDPTRLFIPDIFSPNNDGSNDYLFVRGQGIQSIEFLVFNQWGQLVFRTTNPDVGWDGNLHGNNSPSGVYVYQLDALMIDGLRENLYGNVTLIR
jgi:gliding motility-associated-like protein